MKDLFSSWLERHFPERRDKVLNRVRALRGGRLNDPRFGTRMRGTGVVADQIRDVFQLARQRAGLAREAAPLVTSAFRAPRGAQLDLF